MKGGARVRSGPPADPNALRRDRPSDTAGWIRLPAAGRAGDPPEWPLAVSRGKAIAARELLVWERAWRRPQAVMWERLGLEEEVALYVRALVHAERPRSRTVTSGDRTLVRQLMDDLGISVAGLRSHRWIIEGSLRWIVEEQASEADDEPAPERPDAAPAQSARERFRLMAGGQE